MTKLLTTENVPMWAIPYLWYGDTDDLNDEEIKLVRDWEDRMFDYARAVEPNMTIANLTYDMCDGEDAEPHFTNLPAFGLGCDVYDVQVWANYNEL